jgi:hypothetical protein
MTPEVAPSAQTPAQGEGLQRRYRATRAFNLSFFLTGALNDRSGKSGCAGPQLDFPDHKIQGVAEVWVPFEEAIAIGW